MAVVALDLGHHPDRSEAELAAASLALPGRFLWVQSVPDLDEMMRERSALLRNQRLRYAVEEE